MVEWHVLGGGPGRLKVDAESKRLADALANRLTDGDF
jgi:hypothetical protein